MKAHVEWKKLFSKKHLEEHYFEKIQSSSSVGMDRISPQKFQDELESNIDVILRKTNNNTYHFTRYRQLLFSKGAKKAPREISLPTIRDRLTLSVLNELITNVYEQKCVTQLPQVIINSIMTQVNKYDYFIKLDVDKFYFSINQDKLLKTLKKKIRKKEILDLIKKAIQTPSIPYLVNKETKSSYNWDGIPEGLAISNSLANIYLMDIDKKYSDNPNIKYWRYVDDILILTNKNQYQTIQNDIIHELDLLGLKRNDKADVGEIAKGFSYLGYKILPNIVSVRERSILKLEQSLETLFRQLPSNNPKYIQWKLNLKITGFIINKNKYGWVFFFSQITDMNLLFHLDDLVKKYIQRFQVEQEITPKRFVRAYFDIRKSLHNLKYVPNFDEYTIDDRRDILSDIYDRNIDKLSDNDIEYHFNELIAKEIEDIEKDVQEIS